MDMPQTYPALGDFGLSRELASLVAMKTKALHSNAMRLKTSKDKANQAQNPISALCVTF